MNIIDFLQKMKRGAQIMTAKDIGMIIAETGVTKDWKVLEAGTGSGAMMLFLANLGCKVFSYEKEKRFFEIAQENIKCIGARFAHTNIKLFNADVKNCREKNFDLIVLDLKDADKLIKDFSKKLKKDGFLVVYVLHVEDVTKVCRQMEESGMKIKILENLVREWQADFGKGFTRKSKFRSFTRPKSQMTGHTGFLIFGRK